MKKTKLIIITSQPINKFNARRFGLKVNIKNFSKEFWCLLPLIDDNLNKEIDTKNYRIINHKNIKNIKTFTGLVKNILKLKSNFYFINWSGMHKYNKLMEILLKYRGGTKIIRMFSNVPTYSPSFKSALILFKLSKFWFLKKALTYLKNKIIDILYKPFNVKPKYFFLESSYQGKKFNKENKFFFYINSFDYSEFLRIKNKQNKKKNIIFIDSEKENSFESRLLKLKRKNFNKELYWSTLLNIFLVFEKNFKHKVKVAAHFRRSIKNVPINRKFIFDQTPQLIRDSKIVLVHNSTTVIWAVLFNKPIIFINFENFKYLSMDTNDEIEFYKKNLGANVINVDSNYKFKLSKNFHKNLFRIDKKKYELFKNNFLKNKFMNHKDLNGWQTMMEKLKKIDHSKYI